MQWHNSKSNDSVRAFDETTLLNLVCQARLGDSASFASLVNRFRGILRAIAKRYFARGADHEDILQEALIGLFYAVRDYSDRKGSFSSFVSLCVERQVITYIKAQTRAKHKPHTSAVSLNGPSSSTLDPYDLPLETRLASPQPPAPDEDHLNFIIALWKRCSPLERAVLTMYTQGYSFEEMGATRGKQYKAVDNAVWRVKVKARKLRAELPPFEL
jgi:RNA polymerase sporulation-specific sigma factor